MELRHIIMSGLMAAGLTACKQNCDTTSGASVSRDPASQNTVASNSLDSECSAPPASTAPPTAPLPEQPAPEEPEDVPSSDAVYPLLWEATRSEGKAWTAFTLKLIQEELAADLMPGASDVEKFCPRYHTLTNQQRANFWGLLVSAMTKYESNFNPLSRMREPGSWTDAVTGLPVYSEGLLQLSYQDAKWYTFCDFDWSKDKNLPATSPKKSVLDPYKNLECGIKILARQIVKRGVIGAKKGQSYWSVLTPDHGNTKVPQIIAFTKKMPGCQ